MKKNLILYGLLIMYLLLSFWLGSANLPLYNEVINPLIWIILCMTALFLSKEDSLRVKDEGNKTQSLIIAMIVYIIIYYLLGLVFGFAKTPYAKDPLNVGINLWSFASVVFFQEIIRNSMIRIEKKSIINYIIITILFALVNVSFTSFGSNFSNLKEAFIYTTSTLIPLFVTSGVLTYLSYIGGVKLPIIYRLFILVPPFIVPIIPGLDWFVTAVFGISVPLAVFVYLNFVHIKKTERLSKRESSSYNPVMYVPTFILIAVVVCFVIGLFKYQPIAVLSGSMSPTFNRGDAVVVRKLTNDEKNELDKGDIIEFTSGSKYVLHRIEKVSNDRYGNKIFITKGDANNAVDAGVVELNQVIGKISFVVPYVGYPSVWLSGMVS